MMNEKSLKYLIVAFATLLSWTKTNGCPTCLGRMGLGVKQPFFKVYRPRTQSRYTWDHLSQQGSSLKRTYTTKTKDPQQPLCDKFKALATSERDKK